MNINPNWRTIVKRAWSVRLMLLAGLLSGCEVILPIFREDVPRNLFAVLSIIAVSGGFVARLVAQKGLDDND